MRSAAAFLLLLPLSAASCRSQAVAPAPAAPPPVAAPTKAVGLRLVERAVDGDTLLLAGGERVRILGIDTPEMKHPDAKVHAVALRAQRRLASLAEGRRVRVTTPPGTPERDRYERLLAYVDLPDESAGDLGLTLIEEGLASPYPSPHPRAEAYRAAARRARTSGAGQWEPAVARTLKLVADDEVPCGGAAEAKGALVRVRGTLSAQARRPRVHLLSLRCATGELTLVLFPPFFDEFPEDLIASWTGRDVAVTGEISEYEGAPQIVLKDPFQVEPD